MYIATVELALSSVGVTVVFFTVTPPSNCPERISWSALCFYLKMFMVSGHMRLWRTWQDGPALSVTEGLMGPYLME